MRLLVYANETDGTAERLRRAVEDVSTASSAEVCQTILCLLQRLRQGTADLAAVVLCAFDAADLAEILALYDWLHDLPVIVILPDRESSTVARVLGLRPRYISYLDANFADVTAVLARMISVHRQKTGSIPISSSGSRF
jgi:hypothetical protein